MPLLIGVFGQAIIQVITKPWPWMIGLGFFVVSKFDLGIFAEEVRETVWDFWPFVVLILLLNFGLRAYREYLKHQEQIGRK